METRKKLYRSQSDKALFGVCGGIAEYLDVDSLIVRLLFVLLVLLYGTGILFYFIAALVMPRNPRDMVVYTRVENMPPSADPFVRASEETGGEAEPKAGPAQEGTQGTGADGFEGAPEPGQARIYEVPKQKDGSRNLGAGLITLGGIILLKVFVPWISSWAIVGGGLIVVGLAVIFQKP